MEEKTTEITINDFKGKTVKTSLIKEDRSLVDAEIHCYTDKEIEEFGTIWDICVYDDKIK